jgi:hypothetical protein
MSKSVAIAVVAAGALLGNASAFMTMPNGALARIGAPATVQSICVPSNRQSRTHKNFVLRASADTSVAEKTPQESFAIQVDSGTVAIDPSGNQQIEAKGAYLEDGWVDETATTGSGLGGFFGSLFGGAKTSSSRQENARIEQTMAELDVIEYVDGTKGSLKQAVKGGSAVPFGGLNPQQIEAYNKAKELKQVKMAAMPEAFYIQYPKAQKGGAAAAVAELPDGWYSALDEASGSEYYYNDEGETTWDPPRRR